MLRQIKHTKTSSTTTFENEVPNREPPIQKTPRFPFENENQVRVPNKKPPIQKTPEFFTIQPPPEMDR